MLCNRFLKSFRTLYLNDHNRFNAIRTISLSNALKREVEDRKEMYKSLPVQDEGTTGEKAIDIDALIQHKEDVFPTIDTPNKLFKGVPYQHLPIFHIRVSSNNTILSLTDYKGAPQLIRSCGMEGFKNTRKGTNIAAQATAISIGAKAIERGVRTVRVRVKGLGPGRMSAIKGLQMSGLEIISITDNTPVSWNPPRPRKARKL
ncbi:uncharacterized protein [Onthophagus taurus]|uniref:uncharacterized protein n=1 Tax=Onthophagus taurus TaxID=166361 RepID=UPI0039BE07A4